MPPDDNLANAKVPDLLSQVCLQVGDGMHVRLGRADRLGEKKNGLLLLGLRVTIVCGVYGFFWWWWIEASIQEKGALDVHCLLGGVVVRHILAQETVEVPLHHVGHHLVTHREKVLAKIHHVRARLLAKHIHQMHTKEGFAERNPIKNGLEHGVLLPIGRLGRLDLKHFEQTCGFWWWEQDGVGDAVEERHRQIVLHLEGCEVRVRGLKGRDGRSDGRPMSLDALLELRVATTENFLEAREVEAGIQTRTLHFFVNWEAGNVGMPFAKDGKLLAQCVDTALERLEDVVVQKRPVRRAVPRPRVLPLA